MRNLISQLLTPTLKKVINNDGIKGILFILSMKILIPGESENNEKRLFSKKSF